VRASSGSSAPTSSPTPPETPCSVPGSQAPGVRHECPRAQRQPPA
jgi:hypothetical protein